MYNNSCLTAPGVDPNVVCSSVTPIEGKYTWNIFIGVCRTLMYSTRAFWKKRPMNRKFDHCVSQKDVTLYIVTLCRCVVVTS